MSWLNYHHLLYFWATARRGSITAACEELHLTPQTISAQIRRLERTVGGALFRRTGRRMELTELGRLVFRYADGMFSLGRELEETLRGQRPAGTPLLQVGMSEALPKLIAHHVLAPALATDPPTRLVCQVGKPLQLLSQLATHQLDLVLSDAPLGPGTGIRAYNHLLGETPVSFMAAPRLAKALRRGFPRSLHGAPLLLPSADCSLRPALDRWLDEQELRPRVVGEFADSAVLKVFGQEGAGAFAVPGLVAEDVARQYGVRSIATVDALIERFYAISVERRVKHPAVAAILNAVRDRAVWR